MATVTQDVTIQLLGEQLYKANKGIEGLKTDMMEMGDRLEAKIDKVISLLENGA